MKIIRLIIFCCCLLVSNLAISQFNNSNSVVQNTAAIKLTEDSTYHLHINKVTVVGNKKTKAYIITREAQLNAGDSILTAQLYTITEQARLNVYNTTLFNDVKINIIAIDAFTIDIEIIVKERWYIYPTPQFRLVDRNFNEWKTKYNADLRRVIYGVKFAHYNFSGRRDQVRLSLLNGYSRGVLVSYTAPYSNKKLTEGFSVGVGYTQTREVNYATSYNNSLKFFSILSSKDSNLKTFINKNFSLSLAYRIRKGVFNTHVFGVSYINSQVSDSITLKYNPNYFGGKKSSINYVDFSYSYVHTNVNNVAYPLKGNSAFVSVLKRGFGFKDGINSLMFEAGYNKFIDLGKGWYFSNGVAGLIRLPFKQAYINQRGLGFGIAYLRGLELYAIDGVAFVLNKATLKKKIASFNVKLPFTIPFILKKNEKIPFTFFAKTYTDIGYNYSKENATFLTNKLLYTGGFGIDMLTFYDFAMRFEYSFNQLNEKGLFLRFQSSF
jgi:outer membrane protein assembly factor BamA